MTKSPRMEHCPSHKDKTPSLRVQGEHTFCYSCKQTGTLLTFPVPEVPAPQ